MKKWEYLKVRFYVGDNPFQMNEYGEKGWEMVTAIDIGGGVYTFMFKRELIK